MGSKCPLADSIVIESRFTCLLSTTFASRVTWRETFLNTSSEWAPLSTDNCEAVC